MRHSKMKCLEVGRRSAADTMVDPWIQINAFVKRTQFNVGWRPEVQAVENGRV